MARITVSFFRKAFHDFDKGKITMSRLVEMLNEEADRQPEPNQIYSHEKCVWEYCPHPNICKPESGCVHANQINE